MMTYYVNLKDRWAEESKPIQLEFDTLDVVMNFLSLVVYGQGKNNHLEVTIAASKKEDEE